MGDFQKWDLKNKSGYTSTTSPCDTWGEKQAKIDIKRARKGTHKYNTRSRVNHVTTFKNSPKMFEMDVTVTENSHIVSEYISHTDSKKDTITVQLLAHHIHCETTGKIWGYRDLVKMDAPEWKNSMCNELGSLSQGWIEHLGTDTIDFIFHKEKPKDLRATYVRAVCDIQPQKTETHRTRLTAGGNLIDYLGEVSTPTSELTTMKLHVNSVISDVKSRYMWMDIKYYYLKNQMDRDE